MKKPVLKKVTGLAIMAAVVASTALTSFAEEPAVQAATSEGQIQVVTSGTTQWQYRDDNTVPADGWMISAVVTDDAWQTAAGSFGAKNGAIGDLGGGYTPEVLLNQYIEGTSDDIPVFYFRTVFDVADPEAVQSVTGSVVYDDAAVIYINGQKIAGFDDGSFDEEGYGGSNASAPQTGTVQYTDIQSLNLKTEGNVLAVELHNGRPSSSDIYLDFQSLVLNTGEQEPQAAQIKGLSLDIGADETQRNAAWLGTSQADSYLQVAVRPESWQEGDTFPEDSAQTYQAQQQESAVSGFRSNKATMTDLQGNTSYLYRVGNDEGWSETYSFTTQIFGDSESFSFLFAGDPQIGASGNSGSDTVNWQATMSRSLTAFPKTSFLLSAGDQVNSNNSDEQYDGFLSPEAIRSIPIAVNVGNHDNNNQRYTDYYNMPNLSGLGVTDGTGDGSGDYWFTYNGTLFMSINSNNTSTAEHKAFLQDALDKNPDAVWTVVTFHHSTYSVANHYTDNDIIQRRTELSPVFSELGIDVVLMGHDHYYTRTYMMEGSNPVIPEGNNVQFGEAAPSEVVNPKEGQVLYLTANSASGSKYYSLNGALATGLPEYVAVQDQSNRTSITNVTVTATEFRVDTYYTDSDNLELMDSFTIRRTTAPTVTVPEGETGKTVVETGKAFNPMTGVSALDCDGNDLTDRVFVTVYKIADGTETQVQYVDTAEAGEYRIVYEVTDGYGVTSTAEQLVSVVGDSAGEDPDNPDGEDPDNPGGEDPENPGSGDNENPGGGDIQNPGDGDNTENPGGGNQNGGSSQNGGSQNGGNSQNGGSQNGGNSQNSGTSGSGQNAGTVNTGDQTLSVGLYVGIMAAAAGAGIIFLVLKRRHA